MSRQRKSALRRGPRYHDPDWWLLAILLTLVMFGTVMIFSATSGMGVASGSNEFMFRQIVFALVGFAGLLIAMNIDYHVYRHLAVPALVLVLFILILLLFLAEDVNGARRWFDLGVIQLQPSELAKPAIIFYLAGWLCSKGRKIRTVSFGLAQFAAVMGLVVGLIMLEPDLGTSLLISTIGLAMFFVAGAQIAHFAAAITTGASLFLVLALSSPYRKERITAFLDPESNLQETGWHLLQARYALGSGGLTGVGLGASRQKFSWLPAPHNDAIFAIIGEELGLIGAGFVLLLFVILGYRGYRIARSAPDEFGMLVGVGLTTWLIFQAVFNIGGVTSSMPFTGITLPFVSYGGSSLIVSMTALGILLNISRQTVRLPSKVRNPASDYLKQTPEEAPVFHQKLSSSPNTAVTNREMTSQLDVTVPLPGQQHQHLPERKSPG